MSFTVHTTTGDQGGPFLASQSYAERLKDPPAQLRAHLLDRMQLAHAAGCALIVLFVIDEDSTWVRDFLAAALPGFPRDVFDYVTPQRLDGYGTAILPHAGRTHLVSYDLSCVIHHPRLARLQNPQPASSSMGPSDVQFTPIGSWLCPASTIRGDANGQGTLRSEETIKQNVIVLFTSSHVVKQKMDAYYMGATGTYRRDRLKDNPLWVFLDLFRMFSGWRDIWESLRKDLIIRDAQAHHEIEPPPVLQLNKQLHKDIATVLALKEHLRLHIDAIQRYQKLIAVRKGDTQTSVQLADRSEVLSQDLKHHNEIAQSILYQFKNLRSLTSNTQTVSQGHALTRLNALAFTFLPLTFVAGLFGMTTWSIRAVWYPLWAAICLIVVFLLLIVVTKLFEHNSVLRNMLRSQKKHFNTHNRAFTEKEAILAATSARLTPGNNGPQIHYLSESEDRLRKETALFPKTHIGLFSKRASHMDRHTTPYQYQPANNIPAELPVRNSGQIQPDGYTFPSSHVPFSSGANAIATPFNSAVASPEATRSHQTTPPDRQPAQPIEQPRSLSTAQVEGGSSLYQAQQIFNRISGTNTTYAAVVNDPPSPKTIPAQTSTMSVPVRMTSTSQPLGKRFSIPKLFDQRKRSSQMSAPSSVPYALPYDEAAAKATPRLSSTTEPQVKKDDVVEKESKSYRLSDTSVMSPVRIQPAGAWKHQSASLGYTVFDVEADQEQDSEQVRLLASSNRQLGERDNELRADRERGPVSTAQARDGHQQHSTKEVGTDHQRSKSQAQPRPIDTNNSSVYIYISAPSSPNTDSPKTSAKIITYTEPNPRPPTATNIAPTEALTHTALPAQNQQGPPDRRPSYVSTASTSSIASLSSSEENIGLTAEARPIAPPLLTTVSSSSIARYGLVRVRTQSSGIGVADEEDQGQGGELAAGDRRGREDVATSTGAEENVRPGYERGARGSAATAIYHPQADNESSFWQSNAQMTAAEMLYAASFVTSTDALSTDDEINLPIQSNVPTASPFRDIRQSLQHGVLMQSPTRVQAHVQQPPQHQANTEELRKSNQPPAKVTRKPVPWRVHPQARYIGYNVAYTTVEKAAQSAQTASQEQPTTTATTTGITEQAFQREQDGQEEQEGRRGSRNSTGRRESQPRRDATTITVTEVGSKAPSEEGVEVDARGIRVRSGGGAEYRNLGGISFVDDEDGELSPVSPIEEVGIRKERSFYK